MVLADDLQVLADRVQIALDESHDYYTYTKRVWRLLQKTVKEGSRFTFRNNATGNQIGERALLRQMQRYFAEYLATSTFQHFVSLFEDFFFELLRLWLAAYPGSLSRKQIDMGAVLKAPDKTAIVLAIIDKELNELKYERLAEWFAYLERLVKLGCPSVAEIEALAEIKASRDILVHNHIVINATYLSKAGNRSRYRDGDKLKIPEQYHRESWAIIKKVVNDMSMAAIKKARIV